jgi:hypothetical protein
VLHTPGCTAYDPTDADRQVRPRTPGGESMLRRKSARFDGNTSASGTESPRPPSHLFPRAEYLVNTIAYSAAKAKARASTAFTSGQTRRDMLFEYNPADGRGLPPWLLPERAEQPNSIVRPWSLSQRWRRSLSSAPPKRKSKWAPVVARV